LVGGASGISLVVASLPPDEADEAISAGPESGSLLVLGDAMQARRSRKRVRQLPGGDPHELNLASRL